MPVAEIHIDLSALIEDILEKSAVESFIAFDKNNPNRHSHTTKKILNVFKYIGKDGHPTIGDIVRFGGAYTISHEFDSYWLKFRNFGPLSLSYMDQWLESLGLKRLGTPPH